MIRRIFCALLVALFCLPALNAHAKVEMVTAHGEGEGESAKAALYDALTQAISQVNGMQMASESAASFSSVKTDATVAVNGRKANVSAEMSQESFQQDVATKTKGLVSSYTILSCNEDPARPGIWHVAVDAQIAKYKASPESNRMRLAVIPFRVAAKADGSAQFAETYGHNLTSYLTQTRRFAILDRDFLAEHQKEVDFLKQSDAPMQEMAKLGNTLGADFIVVGQVNQIVRDAWYKTMKSTGRKFPECKYGTEISLRVIDVATGQVTYSKVFSNIKTAEGNPPSAAQMAQQAASAMGAQLIEAIAPVRVVSASGKSVVLGQGGDTLRNGQRLRLIKLGKMLTDPYTKEVLGAEEIEVGTLEVVDVQPKTSRANIIKCSANIEQDFQSSRFIVRPMKANPGQAQQAAKKKFENRKAEMKKKTADFKKQTENDW
ncbi:TolB-like protein [Desulfobaculum xiamenense]|uniref:TolB-like protein n=1 Tax=Desulfobaculum xiamenense TaxID=995050 RepID=A0A846QK34_9BACT|nr:CsgG/HfaB family protein [Desulfobaculum xiamenense]NJB68501.1 TolB-like protein [Desulfobaculum xiamenense]